MEICSKNHKPIYLVDSTCLLCEKIDELEIRDKEWLDVVTDLEKDWEIERDTVIELTELNSSLKEKIQNLEKGIVELQNLLIEKGKNNE